MRRYLPYLFTRQYFFSFFVLLAIILTNSSYAQCNKHDTTRVYHMSVGQPSGIAIDNDRIVVTGYNQNTYGSPATVQVWNDRFLFTIGQPPTGTLPLTAPEAVTFDAAGNMYVVQTERPDSNIMIYNSALTLVKVIDNTPAQPTHWTNPRGLAFDNANNLYVVSQDSTYTTDTGTGPITIDVPATGKLIRIANPMGAATKTVLLTGLHNPKAVAINGDNLYLSEYGINRVTRFNRTTLTLLDTIAVSHPVDLASTGCVLFCSEQESNTVKVINANNLTAGVQESIHQFSDTKSPSGIALDNDYNLFISDNENNRVIVFEASQSPDSVYTFPTDSTGPGISYLCRNTYLPITDTTASSDTVLNQWKSSDTLVCLVDTAGNVYGLAAGVDTILHVIGTDTIRHYVTVQACTYDECRYTSLALSGAIPPFDTATAPDIWYSSDTTIALAYGYGSVYGLAEGNANVYHVRGADTVSFPVVVNTCPISMCRYTSATTTITEPPYDTATMPDAWYSSDTTVAVVYGAGLVYATGTGNATIYHVLGADTVSVPVTAQICTATMCQYTSLTGNVSEPPNDTATVPDIWYSDDSAIAAVNSSGLVYGALGGSTHVFHVLGTDTVSFPVIVYPLDTVPPGPIYTLTDSGAVYDSFAMCISNVIQLLATTSGGQWSIAPYIADLDPSDGAVWPLANGTATVTYTVAHNCNTVSTSFLLKIELPIIPGAIMGPDSVCRGSSTALTELIAGGLWSSNSVFDTVSSSGLFSGVETGAVTIYYTVNNACGANQAMKTISVDTTSAGAIYGIGVVCVDSQITLTDSTTGGIWSISDANASISGGVITGVAGGADTVTYAVTGTCGTAYALYYVTVATPPNAGIITGADTVCLGSVVSLADPVPAGIWTAANSNVSVSGGLVTGDAAGADSVFYTLTNTCGSSVASSVINVLGHPYAGIINGISSLCPGAPAAFTDTVSGGAWLVANANADVTAGTVTGSTPGGDTVIYVVVNSCFSDSALYPVIVNNAIPAPVITTESPDALCNNTMYQNFGAQTPPPFGGNYIWSAQNAQVWAVGDTRQYSLINFNNTGMAIVTLTAIDTSGQCPGTTSYTVTVANTSVPYPEVIYSNGQFMCTQNTTTAYQWGYDNKLTLDSTLLPGETQQFYINSDPAPEHAYWVMITNPDECTQKAYLNVPAGISNVNTEHTEVHIFPNPATALVTVEINTKISGDVEVELINLMGQKLCSGSTINGSVVLNMANLPAGTYLVNCYRDGIKVNVSKLVKN